MTPSTLVETPQAPDSNFEVQSRSLWVDAWKRLKKDKIAIACIWIIVFYAVLAVLTKLGVVAAGWDKQVGDKYSPPVWGHWDTLFGTDIFGRSVFYKAIQGAQVAMSVGFVSALISAPIGIFLGSAAGYYGKWIDEFVVWLYTTVSSIPQILLLLAITWSLGKGISSIYIALGVTSWISLARVLRGEFIKHKSREYVIAAESLGASHFARIFRHILPNVFHFVIIDFSINFMSAIKSEVILSFLGLGVQGQPSWGVMIDDSKLELSRGVWWQLGAATFGMFFIVLAFNLLGDALRDALDPKIK
jgi:ABC-type dipeptide/oligopeptide/nickel transport system permease subunit